MRLIAWLLAATVLPAMAQSVPQPPAEQALTGLMKAIDAKVLRSSDIAVDFSVSDAEAGSALTC